MTVSLAATLTTLSGSAVEAVESERLPEIVVLDPGAEPRQLLRYDFEAGQVDEFTIEIGMAARGSMQGTTTPWIEFPPASMTGTSTVLDVLDDGSYVVEFEFEDVFVPDGDDPAMAAGLRTQMSSLVGTTIRARLDDRGRLLESETSMASGATSPQGMPQPGQFDAMAVQQTQPLPEEPVGVGATWEVTTRTSAETAGMETETTTRMTVEELASDGSFIASGQLQMSAEPQVMAIPGMPDSVVATLDEMSGEGSYRWDIDPGQPIITSEGDITTSMAMTVSIGDESETTEMEMRMKVKLQPVED
jgi:hypothetical protein